MQLTLLHLLFTFLYIESSAGLTPRLLTLRGMFWFPGYREFFLSTGSCAATKEGMEHLLRFIIL